MNKATPKMQYCSRCKRKIRANRIKDYLTSQASETNFEILLFGILMLLAGLLIEGLLL